jgi:dephospho-CoA kinase
MLRLGLTGNIASGKSLVAAHLARKGAVVIDADRIGHELIGPGGAALADVVAEFGPGVLGTDGGVDRAQLGTLVFAEPAALARLNAIVHPRLVAEIRRRFAELAAEAAQGGGPRVAVLDAALIFELDVAREFDRVWVVTAPERSREARLVAKGLSPAEARRRIAAQRPEAEKAGRADCVIANDGTTAELAARVDALWDSIAEAAGPPVSTGKDEPT